MIARRNIFTTGILLFVLGLIIPVILNFLVKLFVRDKDQQFNIIYYIFFVGVFVSLCMGAPLVIVGIFLRSKRNPGGRPRKRKQE
ncbi:MAG: hypothetical protein M3362_02285 [Acidobacteriota bacterium]|nr:hypothetical protein [Acidobacteriota bacterium]